MIEDKFKFFGYIEKTLPEYNDEHIVYQKTNKDGSVSTIEFKDRKIKFFNTNNICFEMSADLLKAVYRQCNALGWFEFEIIGFYKKGD